MVGGCKVKDCPQLYVTIWIHLNTFRPTRNVQLGQETDGWMHVHHGGNHEKLCSLVAQRPSTTLVYLGDRSAQTFVCAATQIEVAD